MVVCPHCKKVIDHLDYYCNEYVGYNVTKNGTDWDSRHVDDVDNNRYECPLCCTELARDEREAMKLLEQGTRQLS